MATILLSAAGAAAGSAVGGSFLGISSAVLGRAIGASVGRAIDERLLGRGSSPVSTGRVERFRVSGAGEGDPIARLYGRHRLAGHVIWASNFLEHSTTTGGSGKGSSSPTVTEYSYSVSLALGICQGEIAGIGRIWADGREIAPDDLSLRLYTGSEDQLPDPRIEAVEGTGNVPAYRGLAYVVVEDLDLTPFGNRVPQLSFEVYRPAPADLGEGATDPARAVQAVALIPGSGEYALATSKVHFKYGPGDREAVNVSTPSGKSDLLTSLDALSSELPACGAVSLVVSWFSGELRCDRAQVEPKVEQTSTDGEKMAWSVSGVGRGAASVVPQLNGGPVYGGTPCDASVIEAIAELNERGQKVMFYPFILMDQLGGNGLTDPWTGASDQPALPWRGRMTLSVAPGEAGSPDGTTAAKSEVDAFFGQAQASDFTAGTNGVAYSGPAEWSFRRFILHYAHLCVLAGGVDAFCIGSELRGLTQIRGASGTFPAVDQLMTLVDDLRGILGPNTKIGYAADWSEYFGYQPNDGSGDVYFNLDPLWAHAELDFIGIDNYMPLSDWREGATHADAGWGSIYNPAYLRANIEGGEGYDWFYASTSDADAQKRSAITDGAYGEDWLYRYKDIRGWWSNLHFNRVAGVREDNPTAWVPQSKPIWFTELGCAAIDKGTNQPNKFLDPKSSESALPAYSNGRRDDLIQMQYLAAMFGYWSDAAKNPVSNVYAGPMIDMSRAHVWAWDARPFPYFPANSDKWGDAANYAHGHWLNGRAANRSLASVVAEICQTAGVTEIDVSALYGLVRGFAEQEPGRARSALQPLMLAYGFEAAERDGKLVFRNRHASPVAEMGDDDLVRQEDAEGLISSTREAEAEIWGRLRIGFAEHDGDYEARLEEAALPDDTQDNLAVTEMPLVLTRAEARGVAARWLAEARIARDAVSFALPPSARHLGAGDVVALTGSGAGTYRIDRVGMGADQKVEATRIEPGAYAVAEQSEEATALRPFNPVLPLDAVVMDLPLLTGAEIDHAPSVAAAARPWPGTVAVFGAASDSNYALMRTLNRAAVIGVTETDLAAAAPGRIDRGDALRVRLGGGALQARLLEDVMNGANMAAIGDGTPDNWEVFQFADAELVTTNTYDISTRLRGQVGTDAMGLAWPAGSLFVLLDGGLPQADFGVSARGLTRHLRIGPASRPYSDESYEHIIGAYAGNGLRPLSPVHLRVATATSGDISFGWVRRGRIDADSWQSVDIPLGEEAELYRVRLFQASSMLREEFVAATTWTYGVAMQAADGASGDIDVEIAQVSNTYGPGLPGKVKINV